MDHNKKGKLLLLAAERLRKCGRTESAAAITRYASEYSSGLFPSTTTFKEQRPFGVSVILPTYKGAGRICRALDSLVAQTEERDRFEIIVISNGPEDTTPDLIAEYQRRHEDLQIVFLRVEKSSASNARNLGLQHARFMYCTFLDDDDFLSPQFISVMLKEAKPNRIVLSSIIDFDETGNLSSPITAQLRAAVRAEGSNRISRPFNVRGILSMTCAKLAPTSCLASYSFDVDLRSGEDVVFWTNVIAGHQLDLWVSEENDEAIYYREIRQGSISRRSSEFSFSVTERLEVVSRIQAIEDNQELITNPDLGEFVKSRYAGQCGFIIRFLKENRDRYQDFLLECVRLGIRNEIIQMIKEQLPDTLVISYCFPPFNDTSAIVMMKRIIGWQWPVRVISNDMTDIRNRSSELTEVLKPYLASHVELKTPVSFSHERAVRQFALNALSAFQKIPKKRAPSSIYSRAMWPASHFAAALIKVHNPHVRWIAEFSDPLVLDIHGNEREGEVPSDWLELLGLREVIEKFAPRHLETRQIFRLAELLPYILADELVFTNEGQRHYMLCQPWLDELRDRALAISTIRPHPSLPPEYYSVGNSRINVDKTKINIGFFGSFYQTRGLGELLIALKQVSDQGGAQIALHVVSSDSSSLLNELNALGIGNLVHIHPSLPYFDCLASFSSMDYLLVNDAVTEGIKPLNPYLPSKLSDYLGSNQAIWALVEPGSTLSKASLPEGSIMSPLGDIMAYTEALNLMANSRRK
ncbi:MAG: glycosyltransferase [Paracoccus sp. (in: a-proteobacteria)]|nr:glycosyltransferase [Paracoccus sp. (in: a-proteobacteria)]